MADEYRVDEDKPDEDPDEIEIDGKKAKKFELTEEDEDSPNLVPLFEKSEEGREALKKIADNAIDDFNVDWDATDEHRDQQAQDWKLFAGRLPLKRTPFKDAANVHVPSMVENMSRVIFRAYDELVGDGTHVATVLPVGKDDYDVARKLTRHTNWQISNEIEDFFRQLMRAMMQFFIPGDVIGHSYRDEDSGYNAHEALTCDDVVVPYAHVTTKSDFGDVPRITRIRLMYRHQLQAMRKAWSNVDKVLERKRPEHTADPQGSLAESQAHTMKIEIPTGDRNAPYKILEHETWTDEIPDQDRDRYIQVVVDYATREVLKLTIHEEAPWQETLRYETEVTQLEQYREARVNHATQQETMTQQLAELDAIPLRMAPRDPMGMPMGPDETAADREQQRLALDPELLPRPPVPSFMMTRQEDLEEVDAYPDPDDETLQPERPKKKPIRMFTHAVCIEPMVGNLGLGFGRIQSDFNKALNIMMSQQIDSATLANAWGLIVHSSLEFERPFTFGPGVVNVVKGITNLRENIFPLQPGQANPQMMELFNTIWGFAQSSAQSPEVLSGQPGKSGETFRGINARIEQATKQLSVPTRAFAREYLKRILINNAKLNSMFMPDEQILFVNDDDPDPELKVGKAMYERDYRVTFGDLRFISREQRVAEADEASALANPPNPNHPMHGNIAYKRKAMAKQLEARGTSDLIDFLGPEMPPPQTPFGIQPPAPAPPPGAPAPAPPAPGAVPQQG